MNYAFDIVFKKHKTSNPTLEWVRAINVSGICVFAKNGKFGRFYRSKFVRRVEGKFAHCTGSHSSPCLSPLKDTIISVHNFPKEPKLDFDKFDLEFKNSFLSIENIQKH